MNTHAADSSRIPPSHFGRSISPSFEESTRSRCRTGTRSRSRTPSDAYMSRSRSRSGSPRRSSSSKPTAMSASRTAIYVENLSPNVRTSHLEHIFGWYGDVVSIHLSNINRENNRGRRWAYIQMSNVQEATKAVLYMSGGQIDGIIVGVRSCVWPKDLPLQEYLGRETVYKGDRRGERNRLCQTDRHGWGRNSWSQQQDWTGERRLGDSQNRIIDGGLRNNNNNNNSNSYNDDRTIDRRDDNKPMRKWGVPAHASTIHRDST